MYKDFYDPYMLNLEVKMKFGVEYLCKCINPEHSDNNPSAYFNCSKGTFYCHSCGFSANVFEIKRLTGGKVYKTLNNTRNVEYSDFNDSWHKYITSDLALENPYLLSRNVNNDLIKRFNIQKTTGGIVFPITNIFNETVAVQVRFTRKNSKIRYLYNGLKTIFPKYDLENIYDKNEPVFVTEGIFGTLNAIRCGFQAICIFGAENIPKEYFNNKFHYIGVFDNDDAGRLAAHNLLKVNSYYEVYMPGCEADEISKQDWQNIYDNTGNCLTNNIFEIEANLQPKIIKLQNQRHYKFINDKYFKNKSKYGVL